MMSEFEFLRRMFWRLHELERIEASILERRKKEKSKDISVVNNGSIAIMCSITDYLDMRGEQKGAQHD